MKQRTAETIALTVLGLVAVNIFLLVMWLFWSLWTFVMPQIWPSGPTGLIDPDYWLFVAEWVLISITISLLKTGSR